MSIEEAFLLGLFVGLIASPIIFSEWKHLWEDRRNQ